MNLERIGRGIAGITVELSFDNGSKDSDRLAALLQEVADDMRPKAETSKGKELAAEWKKWDEETAKNPQLTRATPDSLLGRTIAFLEKA